MTSADVARWLASTVGEVLELQKPAADDAVVVRKEIVAV